MAAFRYIICKSFSFDAAHNLPDMPAEHPCAALHGHTYTVDIELGADELDARGMVYDFTRFRAIKNQLDHKYLNKVMADEDGPWPTTSEMLSKWIWDQIDYLLWNDDCRKRVHIRRIRVSETPSSFSEISVEA